MIDTNKTSEDELRKELERLYRCVVYDLIDDADRKELWIKEVKELIRTEKLKLLEKVRERVVGEDDAIDNEYGSYSSQEVTNSDRNELREEQRARIE